MIGAWTLYLYFQGVANIIFALLLFVVHIVLPEDIGRYLIVDAVTVVSNLPIALRLAGRVDIPDADIRRAFS